MRRRVWLVGATVTVAAALSGCSDLAATTTAAITSSSPAQDPGTTSQAVPQAGRGAAGRGGTATPTVSASPTRGVAGSASATARASSSGTSARVPSSAVRSSTVVAPSSRPPGARIVGTGTPASCTSAAVVAAVAAGGVVAFDCGPSPVTIVMTQTAKVVNKNASLVLDGGGLVTLSGGGVRRILYQNTCDSAQGWTTTHCDDQATPTLQVRNLTFTRGNSTGQTTDGGGGGAIFVRGGRLSIVNSTFTQNRCDPTGPDVGGGAVRVLDQYHDQSVTVSGSTFTSNSCSNGGAISSIGVSWQLTGSVFRSNTAVGNGANPARAGTPGGGNGGAIALDGNQYTLSLRSTTVEDNTANEGGGAIFFVSNNRTGTATLAASTLRRNTSKGFETQGYPGIFFQGASLPSLTQGTTLS